MSYKLTDNEIIKALECCKYEYDTKCELCSYNFYSRTGCRSELRRNALDLINRLQADCENYKQVAENQQKVTMDRGFEIKELKAELDEYAKIKTTIDEFWEILLTLSLCKRKEKPTLEEFAEAIQEIKAEAYKEFAERLHEELRIYGIKDKFNKSVFLNVVDNAKKELVGEDNG